MELKMNNGYIMSRLDLSVLLLSAKKDRICSLALPKANEIDDLQMLSSAFRLARDGLLEVGCVTGSCRRARGAHPTGCAIRLEREVSASKRHG